VSNVAYYFDMYNLLSEPSLSLWTRAPRDAQVSYPDSLPIGESSFTITVTLVGQPVEGALAAVRREADGIFEAGYTDASGAITLTLDPAPATVGPMEVTVTKHDVRPHEGTAQVIAPDSPWLVHRSHLVDDAAGGDGDGQTSPGETFIMPVTVENVGEQPGTGLQGTLTTSTPAWAEVLDDHAGFPDLAPLQQGESLPDHYRIRVSDLAPDGALLGFDLHWSANGGASGTTSFSEPVIAVDLDLDHVDIDDSELGNGNGVAGPGETVDLTITLVNQGHRDGTGIHGTLTCDSPYITLLQDQADYPDIAADGTGTSLPPPYRFAVAEEAPDQQPVTFTLTVTETGSGYDEVIPFEVMISSCATTDSTDVPKQIEDNQTVTSDLDILLATEIGEINVFVDITHTYQGDLRVILVSPAGTECLLHDRTGGSADDIVTWYDNETAPAEPLSVFNGENAFGTWTLRVEDHAGADTGALNAWTLEVCGETIAPIPLLAVGSHQIDDAGTDCDPDGWADVGETVLVNVRVRNDGWGEATVVRASLSSDAAIAVDNNPVSLPDLGIGAEAIAPFEVRIGAVACLEEAGFTVLMEAQEGSWSDGFVQMLEVDAHDASQTEDLEHGGAEPAGWSHEAVAGVDDWSVVADRNHTDPGAWSWFSSDVDTVKDDRLNSPTYNVFEGATLTFWHWVDTESGYDGGVLEIAEEGSTDWTDLGPWMVEGGYDRSLSGTNPISGRDAWTGSYDEWRRTLVDLSAWAGQTVRFRWRMTCDGSVSRNGWWIDDIVVDTTELLCDAHPCGVPGEVRITSVTRQGNEVDLEWRDDPLCLEFGVFRAADPSQASAFDDVTAEDPDPTDTLFHDASGDPFLCWIVEGRGPDGTGPWGHFGR
jgi:subtilisin-like proprotein convertase family protein